MADGLYDRLTRNRFVVIGRAGLDLYPEPDGTKIVDASHFRADLGGSAGNIAVALARLGAGASLLSPLADDPVGRLTRRRLAGYGVDVSLCRAVGGDARNTLALAEIRPTDCEVVIYRNGAADLELAEADIRDVAWADFGAVIATGTALAGDPSRGAVLDAFGAARRAGVPTVLDLDFRPYSWVSAAEAQRVYRQAVDVSDIVIGNDVEFDIVAGADVGPLDFARGLAQKQTAVVIFKLGSAGSITLRGSDEFKTGIFPVEALKPFGAGDSFMGGLMAGLGEGRDLAEAVTRGSAAAALVVSRAGCASAMPTTAELDQFIAELSADRPA